MSHVLERERMFEMLIVKVRESRSVRERLFTLKDRDCEVIESSDRRK